MISFNKFLLVMMCLFAIFSFVSCDDLFGNKNNDGPNSPVVEEPEVKIDYTNYVTDYSIKVKNNTTKKLVAFKGSPSETNLLGGIPAGPGNEHGLKKVASLFATSSDFPLFLVTEEDYLNNINNLGVLANSPFTVMYAYYNTNAENNTIFEISSFLGGDCIIKFNNTSGFNVELRQGKTDGEVIGYAGSAFGTTLFYVNSEDYNLYPAFRKFSKAKNEIITVFPCHVDAPGKPISEPFGLAPGDEYPLSTDKWTIEGMTLDTGCAYLEIQNSSNVGCQFYDGKRFLTTSTGLSTINKTHALMFQLDMEMDNGVFLQSREIGGYEIWAGTQRYVLPTFKFESGKIYSIKIEGSTVYTLTLSEIEEVGVIDFKNM